MNHKLESRLPGEIPTTSDKHTTLMAESEEELKSLWRVKEESEKAGLKLNLQKTKLMHQALGPITSWQIDGEKMEAVTDFFWGAPKSLLTMTTAMKLKDACSLEEKL